MRLITEESDMKQAAASATQWGKFWTLWKCYATNGCGLCFFRFANNTVCSRTSDSAELRKAHFSHRLRGDIGPYTKFHRWRESEGRKSFQLPFLSFHLYGILKRCIVATSDGLRTGNNRIVCRNDRRTEYYLESNSKCSWCLWQWSALFCDLGGILGLYVGFSIMTVFEFFDLGFELIVASFSTVNKKLRGGSVDQMGRPPLAVGRVGDKKKEPLPMTLEDAGTPPPDYFQSDGLGSIRKKKLPEVVC